MTRRRQRLRTRLAAGGLAAGGLLVAGGAAADELARLIEDSDLSQLGRIVVIEGKRGESPGNLTRRIEVLQDEDFHRQPDASRNLAEWMRYSSGQFVNVLSRNDVNWGSAGGLGVKYSTWLLDGLPMDALADGMVLDASAVERVEVLKGPAAVLYSNYLSQDFLGTQSPLAMTANFVLKHHIERPASWLSAGTGSHDTRQLTGYTQGSNAQALSWVASANQEQSDYTQAGAPGSFLQAVQTPRYHKDRIFLDLDWTPPDSGTALSAFVQSTAHHGNLGRPQRDFDHHYDTLNLGWDQRLGETLDARLRFGERRYARQFVNDDYPASLARVNVEDTRQRVRPYDWSLGWRHAEGALLTVGVDGQAVDYQTRIALPGAAALPQDQAALRGRGVFLHEKTRVGSWTLRAGLRHDSIEQHYQLLGGELPALRSAAWSRTLWTLGARTTLAPALALYANVGSSFAPPTAKQVGGTVVQPGVSGELPNPALRAESGIGRDIGIEWQPAAATTLGLRAFVNSIHDAIVTEVVSQLPSQVAALNSGSAESRGLELDLRQRLGEASQLFANLTVVDARVAPGDQAAGSPATPFVPAQVANAGVQTLLPGAVELAAYAQWVGRYYDALDPARRRAFGRYATCDLQLRRDLAIGGGNRARLALDLANAGDRHYDKPFGFRDPGLDLLLSLTLFTP